jgi:hypothetical protein
MLLVLGNAAECYFQQGMTNGTGIKYVKEATIGATCS